MSKDPKSRKTVALATPTDLGENATRDLAGGLNLLLADLSDGQSDLTLVVLLYAAKSDAKAAAQALEAGWDTAALASAGGRTLGDLAGSGTARVAGEGPFLAIYAVETKPEITAPDMLRNRGYHVLMTATYRRELFLLGPAMP